MDKQQEAQGDSISTVGVTVKEYPPSEVYSTEPPPAYHKTRGTAIQIARIAAATVIAVTFILGFFILASAYITATASCAHYVQEQYQQEGEDHPHYQHLVDPLQSEESSDSKHESLVPPPPPSISQQDTSAPIQIKLPLQLDFDELAGTLMERNQRSRMNCIVEKRRAEEVMDHQPKKISLPFGVNLTTDPRYEHVTGERMAIFCESGHDQRHVPMEPMGTPIVVPVPMHGPIPMGVPMGIPMGPGPMFPHHGPPPPPPPMMMPQNQVPFLHPGNPFLPHMPPQMMSRGPQQMMPHGPQSFRPQTIIHHQGPTPMIPRPPDVMPHPQSSPHPAQTEAQMGHIPLNILARIAQEEVAKGNDDNPIHIIAREEHIIPIFHPASPEGHMTAAVPADTVRPPPVPFHKMPIHPSERSAQIMEQPTANLPESLRPHYLQPRSVRSVDNTFLKREKRVRRCACDCAC